ncbi:LysR family transcriptional regulator [Streptomyces sp. CBMA29]|uniref:LysR family transcriptional regulator n=1 Tax=Streptomyces sp. CBMA29 TaxID=1896314 RepID=UPI0016620D38|nr:LysR substrate-binding domain-containing protein [Streptomyces sp. CBMA29]MBD0734274.1 LysR family transcriptional regulator [Streptomyces sp. CBMA29]
MSDLETRELEYFVAVAEELHFGRAAERLSIAQPALSKAIRRVEARLGVLLLTRTSRHVALTPAGEALLHHGRHALNAVGAAAESARRAGDARAQLRLVIKPGGDANLLSGILAAYAERPDARRVDVLFGGATDRADHLRDGRADVALLYAPFDDLTGLASQTLFVEGRVAILPRDHRLAGRTELRLADLDGETLPRWQGVGWAGVPDDGSGPEVADVPQMVQLIVLGRMVAVLPRSLAEPAHPGLVCVPVIDAPTSRLVVAWSRRDDRALVASFVRAAVAAAGRA